MTNDQIRLRIEPETVEAFTIYDAPALDPITVILRDKGAGNGGIIIVCWSKVWACYWGAMGGRHIREFLIDCDAGYIVGKLATASSAKLKKADEKYLTRIVVAVQEALE
jgi:hypothetical protein